VADKQHNNGQCTYSSVMHCSATAADYTATHTHRVRLWGWSGVPSAYVPKLM